ncbi:hypothetical protein V1504DRAFT_487750 [Lipomyces starkeyi]
MSRIISPSDLSFPDWRHLFRASVVPVDQESRQYQTSSGSSLGGHSVAAPTEHAINLDLCVGSADKNWLASKFTENAIPPAGSVLSDTEEQSSTWAFPVLEFGVEAKQEVYSLLSKLSGTACLAAKAAVDRMAADYSDNSQPVAAEAIIGIAWEIFEFVIEFGWLVMTKLGDEWSNTHRSRPCIDISGTNCSSRCSSVRKISPTHSRSGQQSIPSIWWFEDQKLWSVFGMTGWPHGEIKDTGPVFDLEKQLADSFPIRKTDVAVIEHAKARAVTSFIVIPSTVLYKFAENTKVPGVHISDLTALYWRIIEKILQKEALPSGTEGYYFALAHDLIWWEVLDQLAVALNARSPVTDSKTQIWPSDEAAAESLGVPVQFVQPLWNSGENIVSENTHRLGWKPVWNQDRFFQNIDDEIQAVLELGKANPLEDNYRIQAWVILGVQP